MERMGDPAVTPEEHFTYGQYRTWPDSERWELLEGRAWSMSPAPKSRHQALVWRLSSLLFNFLKGRPCKAFPAPFDVLLPDGAEPDDEVATVVQPDISVFCEKSKLTERGARGAPDLVVEILSPSTSKKDQNDKFRIYEKHGVREYWIVDPAAWSLWVYRLGSDGRFDAGELRERLGDLSPISSKALQGFVIDPVELFTELD
jgi:Uma2 family endonuclease